MKVYSLWNNIKTLKTWNPTPSRDAGPQAEVNVHKKKINCTCKDDVTLQGEEQPAWRRPSDSRAVIGSTDMSEYTVWFLTLAWSLYCCMVPRNRRRPTQSTKPRPSSRTLRRTLRRSATLADERKQSRLLWHIRQEEDGQWKPVEGTTK